MKKVLTKSILFSAMVIGLALASCTGKPKEQPAEQPANAPDSALVAAAENNIKAHQEDIQTLWYLAYGDKKISGYSLANDYVYLSSEAFPIFCFLIVEGYLHTHSLRRYMITLLVTAAISEIPWYLLGNHDSHNVVFTLFLGLVAVHVISRLKDNGWLVLIAMTITAGLAWLLNTDYSWNGVCLIVVFYLFRERKQLTVPFGFPFLMEYGVVGTVIGMMLPLGYNGYRGFIHGRYMKYLFYVYYPLHLMVIWLCLN